MYICNVACNFLLTFRLNVACLAEYLKCSGVFSFVRTSLTFVRSATVFVRNHWTFVRIAFCLCAHVLDICAQSRSLCVHVRSCAQSFQGVI